MIYVPSDLYFKKKFIEVPPEIKKKLWLLLLFLYLQCIAAIACTEIPKGQWLEVIDILHRMVWAVASKEQALQSIGYICEDIVSVVLDILFPNLKGEEITLEPPVQHVKFTTYIANLAILLP